MAVKKEATVDRYIGLAADARPTGVRPGSTFLAYDTQEMEVTHDGTNWVTKDDLHTRVGEVQATPTSNTIQED